MEKQIFVFAERLFFSLASLVYQYSTLDFARLLRNVLFFAKVAIL